ncbi:hypothetical protein [Limnochorda pilosa]|uniref:Selenium metabolism hydrolase n=1 Tax=Limnochorda pilosa TaxID=1555112 RepID=A0A0K2SM51_LIMPI|nr:hypothetical protein [Limnochorda pilosa]BAS28186.1 selenium metabolism hydrolase [Limnochorda pilosa]
MIFGPGDLAEAHTTNESVAVEEMERAAVLYAGVLCGFLGREGGTRGPGGTDGLPRRGPSGGPALIPLCGGVLFALRR